MCDLCEHDPMLISEPPTFKQMFAHYWLVFIHKLRVLYYLSKISAKLIWRGIKHDNSKFNWKKEGKFFASLTDKIKHVTYGSDEYKNLLQLIRPALDHHYEYNPHHPEFYYDKTIKSMTFIDQVEMICDWAASAKKHADGDPFKSVQINSVRFNYKDEAKAFFNKILMEVL